MRFNCKIDKITTKQLAIIATVDSIYETQSATCIVDSFDKDKVLFVMKANLSKQQQQRLFADRIPSYIPGYKARIYEQDRINYMEVSNAN